MNLCGKIHPLHFFLWPKYLGAVDTPREQTLFLWPGLQMVGILPNTQDTCMQGQLIWVELCFLTCLSNKAATI